MKHSFIITFFILSFLGARLSAQTVTTGESFGNTLNIGLGVGYYGYVGHAMPAVNLNYEFNVLRNFTLAPFVTLYSYQSRYNFNHQYYYYRQTVIPVGVKGTYYFDRLLHAGAHWDFYVAGSLGFAIRSTRWETAYPGDTHFDHYASGLYLDAHLGVEYHATQQLGIYLDLSTGISTLGLAVHL